jgi:uncharacterized protein YndB with AHSA1/START domain/ketosteroid isomerase-like protein
MPETAEIVRAYHDAWTAKDFAAASALLADTLEVEVPVNEYPTAGSFAKALASFGAMVTDVALLAAMSDGDQAMLLYDLAAGPVGTLRVAEHFTVADGKIVRIRQVHDTAPVRAAGLAMSADPVYARQLTIEAPRERVFAAIATVDGPRHWWTTIVTGSAALGAELRFGFAGLDERMVLRVTERKPPELVEWSCVAHTRANEWTGTMLRFELAERGPDACDLDFRHIGVPADLVADGWEHFLASLAAYAQDGTGTPFGS